MERLSDLRFVIGLFLTIIGVLLFVAHFSVGGGQETEGVRLNWFGAWLFSGVGLGMIALSVFSRGSPND
jgi:hypothetical protein